MTTDLLYQIALTLVPQIGDARAKALALHFGEAKAIFNASVSTLSKVEGISTSLAQNIRDFKDFSRAEAEIRFIEKYKIQPLFLTDKAYPQRLLNGYDSPTLLYYKGVADLNASRTVAIVGTRLCTDYGKQFTEKLVAALANESVTVVSGLAYGIDAAAHRFALKNALPTIGVVGHGLDQIYPAEHASMAKEMILQGGGIVSEFRSGTPADRFNFPLRNRIVAGMTDATIVIETEIKGGSMITAKLANAYNKDVFAVPGRTIDKKSSGCNHLIQYNKAILLSHPDEFLSIMGWKRENKPAKKKQKALFVELTPEEKQIVALLETKEIVHIDEIHLQMGIHSSVIAASMLNLELNHMITSLPGKLYKLS
jgi:DNA processing protein